MPKEVILLLALFTTLLVPANGLLADSERVVHPVTADCPGCGWLQQEETASQPSRIDSLKLVLQQELEKVIQEFDWPGATLGVALPDGSTFQISAGFEDLENEKLMPEDARMLVGSTGKMIVSAVALELVQEGVFSLDDRIAELVGDEEWFPLLANGEEIRIRNLMNHTSGLPRYVFQPSFLESLQNEPQRIWSIGERLELLRDQPALHSVGKRWAYSDTNYIVLGAIMEKICGQSFYDLARSRVIEPLKLNSTIPAVESELPGLAQGYFGEPNPFGLSGQSVVNGKYVLNPQFEWCGGGFLSTSEDLARLALGIHGEKMVDAKLYREFTQAVDFRSGQPSETGYGLGTFVWPSDSGLFLGHAGIMPGYLTQVEYSQQHGFAIAIQCNRDTDMGRNHHRVVQRMARLVASFADQDDR